MNDLMKDVNVCVDGKEVSLIFALKAYNFSVQGAENLIKALTMAVAEIETTDFSEGRVFLHGKEIK